MTKSAKGRDTMTTIAMFAVILITRLVIGYSTDWHWGVAGGIAVVAGLVTAGVVWHLMRPERESSE